uniref:Reverse transcriptase domain, reverse transcriptase zinc-binding domain protein n=1 Tax=Tanacetum cinerariifolium TaxID=118510 RepID=A0A6L2L7M2_TANCI|nr:reverse transcriptase domain, reverse transcriptase zinc-binding domain protein [Tanacetum cinerariifolium]
MKTLDLIHPKLRCSLRKVNEIQAKPDDAKCRTCNGYGVKSMPNVVKTIDMVPARIEVKGIGSDMLKSDPNVTLWLDNYGTNNVGMMVGTNMEWTNQISNRPSNATAINFNTLYQDADLRLKGVDAGRKPDANISKPIGVFLNPNAPFIGFSDPDGLSKINTDSINLNIESVLERDRVMPSSFAGRVAQTVGRDKDMHVSPNVESSLKGDHISVSSLARNTSSSLNQPNKKVSSSFTSLGVKERLHLLIKLVNIMVFLLMAAGASNVNQLKDQANFRPMVAKKVFEGVNISIPRKVIEKKWSMKTSLQKEELTRISIWVKLHDVHIQVFEEDGISLIDTYLGKPIMVDSYTSSMCKDSWGRSSFARCLIEINSEADFKESITIDASLAIYLDTRVVTNPVVNDTNVSNDGFQKVVNRKHNNKGSFAGNKLPKGVPVSQGFQIGKYFTFKPKAPNVGSKGDNGTHNKTNSKVGSSNTNGDNSLITKDTNTRQQDTGKKKLSNIASPNPFAALGVDDDEEEEVNIRADNKALFYFIIYADNYYVSRSALWNNLVSHAYLMRDKPWVPLGDFNATLNLVDHSYGGYQPDIAMREFKIVFNGLKLWMLMLQPYRISDHSPCVLRIPKEAALDEERFLRQKLKIEWLNAGDANTAYFYRIVKSKCARNRIEMVWDSSNVLHEGNAVPGAFVAHYEQFLGLEGTSTPLDDQGLFTRVLDNHKAEFMVRDVSDSEIKDAIFSMGDDKAPNMMVLLLHSSRSHAILWVSTTFFCNVSNALKSSILSSMPFAEGSLYVKYLGVPLISSRWADFFPLRDMLTVRNIVHSGFYLSDMVSNLISNGSWRWPHDWLSRFLNVVNIPVLDIFNDLDDVIVWPDVREVFQIFSVAGAWDSLRLRADIVDWRHVVWFPHCIPRHVIHLWLVIKEKLKT